MPILLDCLPVQTYLNSPVNFRVYASVTFLINGDQRPLFTVCFLKHLEMSPFHWRQFCRCTINRLSHTFPYIQNIFKNGALIPKIYSACSFMAPMFPLGNCEKTSSASCLSAQPRALLRANLHISVFCACATHSTSGFSKFQYKRFGDFREKSEKLSLFVVVFMNDTIQYFESYPYFQNTLMIFMVFTMNLGAHNL